jgi:CheY-like chemotaxis protein
VVVEVSSHREQDGNPYEIKFAVRDTGIGIPASRLHRLFQSFSQVEASTTRKYGGTGLGLAISKRLAELMGGTMWTESVEGQGATFYFTIRAHATPMPKPIYADVELELRGKRVLVVDDNPTNRRILELQLKSWQMIPVLAATPAEALTLVQQGEVADIAILDMAMPEMDGEMLAKEIRRLRTAQQLPLILFTSLGNFANVNTSLFATWLAKPIKPSPLYNALVGTLAKHPSQVRPASSESQFDTGLAQRVPARILVAEDNVVNQKLALRMLERLGYRPDIAANGFEVLTALRQWHYDLVLMDVQMPEMDGLEATQKILTEWATIERPRIIAMTANAMEGDREMCLAAGMDDYVSKPIQVKELQIALERWGQKVA